MATAPVGSSIQDAANSHYLTTVTGTSTPSRTDMEYWFYGANPLLSISSKKRNFLNSSATIPTNTDLERIDLPSAPTGTSSLSDSKLHKWTH